MKAHWTAAILLSTGLLAGCNASEPEGEDLTAPVEDSTAVPGDDQPRVSATPDTSGSTDTDSRAGTRSESPRANAPARRSGSTTQARSQASDATAKPAEEPEYRELRVEAGTALPLELETAISSETATVEMPVQARLTQAISVNGVTLLPTGTQLTGSVTDVQQAGRVKGRARVTFVFNQAVVNGSRRELVTEPITFEAQSTRGEDATKIGVGAGVGAAIGGILGGGSGAAKGAAIGGAAGTGAVLATKGQHVQIAEGTAVAAALAEDFTTEVRVR